MHPITVYQVKEAIHNYLWDIYCMDKKQINQFLESMSDDIILKIANHQVTIHSIVDSMISWGNKKVERCIRNTK